MYRAAGKAVEPTEFSKELPGWCHSVADRLGITIFKGIVGLAPKGKFDARNYGQMVGFMLRAITYFCKEVPAELKREGLLELDPEKEKKIEAMIDMTAILSFASEKFKRPIADESETGRSWRGGARKKGGGAGFDFACHRSDLLSVPLQNRTEFLCGIPEGFRLFLNNDGGILRQRSRTELYLLLLMFWPEITEMQKAEPQKTCKFLLDWLEKQEKRGSNFLRMKSSFMGYVGRSDW